MSSQAGSASYIDDDGAPDHYIAPLPARTIKSAVAPIAGLAAVRQPYTSFGARPAETDASFYTGVSERLRHKQRGVTFWDYERLIFVASRRFTKRSACSRP